LASTRKNGIFLHCSQEKWDKAKAMIQQLQVEMESMSALEHKELECIRGFLVHLQRIFPTITPFLKGIHLTLDGWCPNRDAEMWKDVALDAEDDEYGSSFGLNSNNNLPSVPERVQPAPCLADDLAGLAYLFNLAQPPYRLIRASSIHVCLHGFVDASRTGFRSSLSLPNGSLYVRQGVWGQDADGRSSNY
jgi:hypothetical protein